MRLRMRRAGVSTVDLQFNIHSVLFRVLIGLDYSLIVYLKL